MRRTKIICTLGPASGTEPVIRRLILAGMNACRLNFSHGTYNEHARLIRLVRKVSVKLDRPVAIIQDLQGPKLRIGEITGGEISLKSGSFFSLTTRNVSGDTHLVSISPMVLRLRPKKGQVVLLDDGKLKLRVLQVKGKNILCRVGEGGILKSRKGIHLAGTTRGIPSLTPKDKDDLQFGLSQKIDYVAVSYIRDENDVLRIKREMRKRKRILPVIAKLEKKEALENLNRILAVGDGVMVARGDLGVELSPEHVPLAQKQVIREAARKKIPVITATQMLESMIENPAPTRAEASDIANAVWDGTDAVMLSGETAVGKYPVEAAKAMASIIEAAEKGVAAAANPNTEKTSIPDAVTDAACRAAKEVGAKVVVVFTESGQTARFASSHRPPVPIVAFTPHRAVLHQMALLWGVVPKLIHPIMNTEQLVREAEKILITEKLICKGNVVIFLLGSPLHVPGTTNLMKIHTVGT